MTGIFDVVLYVFIGFFVGLYALEWGFSALDDPREPPRIASKVPVVGHLFGFYRFGSRYFTVLGQRTDAGIFTIGILGYKVYVTYDAKIINLIQKSKSITFKSTLRENNRIFARVSNEAHALYDGALLDRYSQRTREAFAASTGNDDLSRRMAGEILDSLDKAVGKGDIDLLEWTNHTVIQATSAALYGACHPFKDPKIEMAAWAWNDLRPMMRFGLDFWGQGSTAQKEVLEAFKTYLFSTNEDMSPVVRERQNILIDGGMREDDVCRMQANLIGDAFANTSPSIWWTVYEIFSRQSLLADVRAELMSNAVKLSGNPGYVLDLAAVQTRCPLLLSCFQETARTRHSLVAFRQVDEDTHLGNFVLKRGIGVQVPTTVLHKDPHVWGTDPECFNPHRFLNSSNPTRTKIAPSNFLAWGIPQHLCPARQMVTTEILLIVALLVLRVDLIPDTVWERNPAARTIDVPTLPRPKQDVHLRVIEREKNSGSWTVSTKDCVARIPLASG